MQKVVEMALKLQYCFLQNHENHHPGVGGYAPRPLCDMLTSVCLARGLN